MVGGGEHTMSELLKAAIKGANKELQDTLFNMRATRAPSKMKRELRRKYAKKHTR